MHKLKLGKSIYLDSLEKEGIIKKTQHEEDST